MSFGKNYVGNFKIKDLCLKRYPSSNFNLVNSNFEADKARGEKDVGISNYQIRCW